MPEPRALMPDFLMVSTMMEQVYRPFLAAAPSSPWCTRGEGTAATRWGRAVHLSRARMVATSTDTLGVRPERRLFTFQINQKPMSEAKPDSVTWYFCEELQGQTVADDGGLAMRCWRRGRVISIGLMLHGVAHGGVDAVGAFQAVMGRPPSKILVVTARLRL